jgi:aspartate/methionine/tyrosine aminotransferase
MTRLGANFEFEFLPRAQALEREGKEIIHFERSDPDFITPPSVIQEGIESLKSGVLPSTPSSGLPQLRARIAEVEGQRRGIRFMPDQVVVTPGAQASLFYSILALVEEGDEVLYPDPGYPAYQSMIAFAGGRPIAYPLREANNFQLDSRSIQELLTSRTRLLILNSPNNPTGSIENLAGLRELVEVLRDTDVWVLSDEIYSRFMYQEGRDHASISCFDAMSGRTIVVDGFSKAFSMTGWRVGFGIMPQELVPHISKLIAGSICHTPLTSQVAALAALDTRERTIPPMIEEYRRRRDIMIYRLNRIPGIRCFRPEGGVFLFPNVSAYCKNSKEIAEYLLEQAGVASLAGSEFGPNGEGYLRLSFATSMDKIRLGIERFSTALSRYRTVTVPA